MQIREVGRDDLTTAEAVELARLSTRVSPMRLPTDPPVPPRLLLNDMRPSVPTWSFRYFVLYDGDTAVGAARLEGARNAENAEIAELGVAVDPARRGQGLGKLLYEHVAAEAEADGRTTLWSWGLLDEPTTHFWQDTIGLTLAYDERISRCSVPDVDAALMQQWIDRAAERASGYHLVHAIAPLPDELIGYYAEGLEAMNDAPLDDLELEQETFSIERAREIEELHLTTSSEYRTVFAIETATGDLAGFTALRVPDAEPSHSHQGDTVTRADHRNRGIGRWLKAAMWQWLRDERPEVQFLDTGNAESNRAMLAINEAMGFRDILHHGVWHDKKS